MLDHLVRRPLCLLVYCLFMIAASVVHAGEQPSCTLEPVKVTAQKQEENVQDIPGSVSAISAMEAEDARLLSVDDLASRIPNLGFYTGGMDMINFVTLRGVTSDPHNNISAVALYVDDVPVVSNLGFISQLYDLERVEVLRGPQGTLYGRNSEGGVINVITRMPQKEFAGKVTVEGGSGEMARVMASGSGEVVEDRLFLGGSAQFYQRNGWVHNDYDGGRIDDRKNYSGNGKVRFTPTEDLEFLLSASLTRYDEGTFGMYPYPTAEKRHVNTNEPGYNRSAIDQQALRIKYRMNDLWSLTSVTSRRYTDTDYLIDYDFSTTPMQETSKFDKYLDLSQEVRVNYDSEDMTAVLGLMADHYDRKVQFSTPKMYSQAKDKTNTYAMFGHTRIPFAEKWALLAGLRADYYTTDFKDSASYADSSSWLTYSPKLALEYSLAATSMLYASVSRGFRAAGYNSYTPPTGKYKFDEEGVWAFEVGSKNMFLANKAKLNVALFANRKTDTQVEQYVAVPGWPPMPYVDNVGDTTAYGAELEASLFLLPGLEVFGSAGYTHVRFGEFSDELGDHRGNRLPYVPDYTYSLGCQYRHATGFMARAEMLGASRVYLDSRNIGCIPAHATVNAKTGWESENTDVYLFVDNLFNEHHDYRGAFGGNFGVATPGLSVGLSLTRRF